MQARCVCCVGARRYLLAHATASCHAGMLLSTLTHHLDYVTCLAASPARNVVATAGLRGEVFLIDLAVGGERWRKQLAGEARAAQEEDWWHQVAAPGSVSGVR